MPRPAPPRPLVPALPLGFAAAVLGLLAPLAGAPAAAAGDPLVDDAHLEAALEEAGENRPALERVLAHFEGRDRRRSTAAAFLIANMAGKGYVVTRLVDSQGNTLEYDPLAYDTFAEARAAIEALEEEHGELEFARDRLVKDLETVSAEYLIRHVEAAFGAWEATPASHRVDFETFLHYVLPHRGSQEPLDDWLVPLRDRYADWWREDGRALDPAGVYRRVSRDAHERVRFNERYYLHPTDQGFGEMLESGQGRCEDITNMITYAARSVGLATAADYTPAWAHRDNNHAWNVLLDAEGRGFDAANAHAAKVYRKTYAIQRDALAFRLPEGREAPNRFLASRSYVDVTDQYAPTTDVVVDLDPEAVGEEAFAYLCVFNGGEWVAIHWGAVEQGRVTFTRMGRNIVYLPAVHDGEALRPAAAPRIVTREGEILRLEGRGEATDLLATSVKPRQVSADTGEATPVSHLEPGATYLLQRWSGTWVEVARVEAGEAPLRFEGLSADALYWLVAEPSRRLERPFTVLEGRQRFW